MRESVGVRKMWVYRELYFEKHMQCVYIVYVCIRGNHMCVGGTHTWGVVYKHALHTYLCIEGVRVCSM